MRGYIKGIAIYKNEFEDKRFVKFTEGLNIITGWEQTGKSAVFDIIDYCLCNPSFPVPKGEITNFASIYSLIICIKQKSYLVARIPKGKYRKLVYIEEVPLELNIDEVDKIDFNDKYWYSIKVAMKEFESILNLTFSDNTPLLFDEDRVTDKTDIRNAFSFMFLHQNTIADKKNLFHYKTKVNQFPILSGWVNQEYYATIENLRRKKAEYNSKKKEIEKIVHDNNFYINKLKGALNSYFLITQKHFNDAISKEELVKIAKSIAKVEPSIPKVAPGNIEERQTYLKSVMSDLSKKILAIKREQEKLKTIQNEGNKTKRTLLKLKKRPSNPLDEYICPICDTISTDLKVEALKIKEAENWLNDEINAINNSHIDYSSEIQELQKQYDSLQLDYGKISTEFEANKKTLNSLLKNPTEEAQYKAQIHIETQLEILEKNYTDYNNKSLPKIEGEIEEYQEQKDKNEKVIAKYKEEAYKVLIGELNTLASELNFGYKPINLMFNFEKFNSNKDFEFYQIDEKNDDTITLEQMGGGSNIVACHLSLFLSFMYYFSVNKNSKVPSILLLDQPSQGYFTRNEKLEKDNAIQKVTEIYLTLLKVIDKINDEQKYLPQIIVADQVDYLGKHTEKFRTFFRTPDWRNGKGFV